MERTLLTLITHLSPEALDAVIPQLHRFRDRGERVFLNPQPLPPHQLEQRFVLGAAKAAHDIARLAIESEVSGRDQASGWLSEVIDDWCGTGWPRRWPTPTPGPAPDPRVLGEGLVVGALVFASLGQRMPDTELGAVFAAGAERMGEVAVRGL